MRKNQLAYIFLKLFLSLNLIKLLGIINKKKKKMHIKLY